jgi:hypothetical protein
MPLFRATEPFRSGERGETCFHPLGRFGPAYIVESETLRRRLATAHRLHWLGSLASLGFLLAWVASYRGPDPLMVVALPLLAYLLVLMAYRISLRVLLRGVPLANNRWRPASSGDEPASGERP